MLESLQLGSFKKFDDLSLKLNQLTLLTGLNGSGKSSVVQALVLMSRAAGASGGRVPLASQFGSDLGEAADVLNIDSIDGLIRLGVNGDRSALWTFDASTDIDAYLPYLRIVARPTLMPESLDASVGNFTYLAAERLGPRISYPNSNVGADSAVVGEDGRFVAHVLAVGQRRIVDVRRRHPNAGDVATLGAQTEAWLSELVGITQLDAALLPRTSLATLRIRTPGRYGEWMLPTNTGFGVSYTLPVIVAGLTVPEGGLFIVDSPEAHLHPAAQSAIGAFLVQVAASGVQVIVETHSDHVLNGIRRAVAAERAMDPNLLTMTFFGDGNEPAVMKMDELGRVSDWPSGFFDQMDSDLGALGRLRKSGR